MKKHPSPSRSAIITAVVAAIALIAVAALIVAVLLPSVSKPGANKARTQAGPTTPSTPSPTTPSTPSPTTPSTPSPTTPSTPVRPTTAPTSPGPQASNSVPVRPLTTQPPVTTQPGVPAVRLTVYPRQLGRVSRYLFGANLLWPDGAEGGFDPARERFYPAFVSEVRQLGITALRYPGGISSDSFDWRRAIGPEASRRLNEPYGAQYATADKVCCNVDGPVPSTVGPDQFGRLLDQTGAIGTVTVNFVTGTAQEAADFVAYMMAPLSAHPSSSPSSASYWAALRAKDGHPAPYDVPYWEVGNEQDGRGQFGWRAGRVITIGPHRGNCAQAEATVCLYAFGGTTAFSDQPVGLFADDQPSISESNGGPTSRSMSISRPSSRRARSCTWAGGAGSSPPR